MTYGDDSDDNRLKELWFSEVLDLSEYWKNQDLCAIYTHVVNFNMDKKYAPTMILLVSLT